MRIGVPAEKPDQPLVAATPDTVSKLIKLGYTVAVQSGAGALASYPDYQYEEAGAELVDRDGAFKADIVLTLDAPELYDLEKMHRESVLISRLAPTRNEDLMRVLAEMDITALAMDVVPRISRAQAMDVLSSQANVAGYRAIIEAANEFGRLFTGQVTAAGKMPPAHVYVIGAGVAGLAAIGTANSMGAEVFASDVRPEVAEQVNSMGARFIALPQAQEKSTDGYAKAMTEDQARLANAVYAKQSAVSDIVITTANIPGRTSPILLDDEAIAAMKPGSVIVDMAAANGGNTTQTVAGQKIVTDNGVTIIGWTDLAGRLPAQSSQLYAQNVVNLLKLMTPGKDGQMVIDLNDEIIRGITLTDDGQILWPPPKIQVSAAPTAKAEDAVDHAKAAAEAAREAAAAKQKRFAWMGIAALLAVALVMVTPSLAIGHYMVFVLAIIVGFYVITGVAHSLHTPLMSVTNAISGIILVGAITQIGSSNLAVTILSFIAIVVASINIFGGFRVTARMLTMFQKG
ncbi:Re/Si-specific NAD(P)(+) transhydrogenase subunit alpha [Actinomyces minihominis]|uniref:Re/Si-specific NAD(P)(+) transhydrogenase subunit alpha n=1 Tax=Actinomyces minihominis TaxID=2002838 RepID=UPI000C086011|nr:Re/Si-specific NAD(P)(+) transhydrogenase subunit alpha [Actinomyces minihominis]